MFFVVVVVFFLGGGGGGQGGARVGLLRLTFCDRPYSWIATKWPSLVRYADNFALYFVPNKTFFVKVKTVYATSEFNYFNWAINIIHWNFLLESFVRLKSSIYFGPLKMFTSMHTHIHICQSFNRNI